MASTSDRWSITRRVLLAVVFALALASCSESEDALPGSGTTVTVARANWSTGYFQAQLYATLLDRLGYDVSDPAASDLSSDGLFEAVALGDADFSPNAWFPNVQLERRLDDDTTIGDRLRPIGEEMVSGAIQGILIDSNSAEQYEVVDLAQIAADPELAALYDIDGNGKADILGCPEAWICDDDIDEIIEGVGGTETIEQIRNDYNENYVVFNRRVQAGEPALAYTWTPNFTVALTRPGKEVQWLSTSQSTAETMGMEMLPGQCTTSPCFTGWETSDIRVVANREFLDREPVAAALFEAVRVPAEDVFEQNLEMDRGADSPEDIQAAVDRWIQNNRSLVVDWLAYARSQA